MQTFGYHVNKQRGCARNLQSILIKLGVPPKPGLSPLSRSSCHLKCLLEVLRRPTCQGAAAPRLTVIFLQEHLVLVSWSRASPVSLCLPQTSLSPERIIISENYANEHILSLLGFAPPPPLSKSPCRATARRSVFCAMFGPCDWKSKCGSCKCVKAAVAPK